MDERFEKIRQALGELEEDMRQCASANRKMQLQLAKYERGE